MPEIPTLSSEIVEKLIASALVVFFLSLIRLALNTLTKKRIADLKLQYQYRRVILYVFTILAALLVGRIWIKAIDTLTTFLGLVTTGLTIAMHDTIANLAGWIFILWRKPFKLGDRIQIGDTAGDVIDIRIFQFSLVEIGNWIDADQSTGRIIHVPNSKILREPLANYHIGFEYIWNEIPVLITFESDWKKAKQLLGRIAAEKAEHLSKGAQDQIRHAARKYFILYENLTPIVYTAVRESGVLLTIRYLVEPRTRRMTEEQMWEAILEAFASEPDITLAYPTTRFYSEHPLNS